MDLPDDDALIALVERMADGDAEAVGPLFDSLSPWVHGALLRMLGDAEAAELLTRRTLLEMWRTAPLWDRHVGRPLLWSMAMARTLGGQWLDEERRAHGEVGVPPEERAARRDPASQVGSALARMSPAEQDELEAAWFRDVHGDREALEPALRRWATVLAGG